MIDLHYVGTSRYYCRQTERMGLSTEFNYRVQSSLNEDGDNARQIEIDNTIKILDDMYGDIRNSLWRIQADISRECIEIPDSLSNLIEKVEGLYDEAQNYIHSTV